MKPQIMIFIFSALCSIAQGQQQTPLSLISTAGGHGQTTINTNTATIEWTIGETFTGAGSMGNQSITIGEQQGLPNSLTGIEPGIFSNIKVYPNPADSYIRIENLPTGNKTISLTDINGRTWQSTSTDSEFQILQTRDLPSGIYTLVISKDVINESAFKISIINH